MGKVIYMQPWREAFRASPPSASGSLIEAAANERRVVERLAERNREAMDRLDEIPSDSEPA